MTRFSRQLSVFGEEGQNRISGSTVGIVGLGGLGSNVITQLASAGVGNFVIADPQVSEESDLNRQFMHSLNPLGTFKTESAASWISSISDSRVTFITERINDGNAHVFDDCDIVVDCTDSDESRMDLNRFAFESGKPLIYGGVESMFGQVSVVIPGITPCLNCFLKGRPAVRCVPSVGAAVSAIASIQAAEALKILTGIGEPLAGKLLTIDLVSNVYRVLDIRRRDGCDVCNGL